MPQITYRKAINDALAEEIIRDENVVIIGEEVARYNGAYKVTEGLWERFGDKRVVDAPISEAGFIGMGVGASMLGIRPVMELMFWSFAYVAWDQIINNAGQVRYMRSRKRRHQCRRHPLSHSRKLHREHAWPEGRLSSHRLRCEGPDEGCHP